MKVIRTDKNGNEIAEVSVTELDTMFKEVKAKAIDEFRAKVNKEIHMCFSDDLEIQKHIDEVAEQMKVGGIDG